MAKELESVKLDKKIVDRVRSYKDKTGIPISTLIEKATDLYLKSLKSK